MKKIIDPSAFYWNPETKWKLSSKYLVYDDDGNFIGKEAIPVKGDDIQKVQESREACQRKAIKEISEDAKQSTKPVDKRNIDEPEVKEKLIKAIAERKKPIKKKLVTTKKEETPKKE